MTRAEFEELVGRKVTAEQYKAFETLYMESNLCKQEFVKSIKGLLKSIPESKPKVIMRMKMTVNGYDTTPNGAWYFIKYVELVDINIATGKKVVKELEEKDYKKLSAEGRDLNLSKWYDFNYTDCVDENGKAIEMI